MREKWLEEWQTYNSYANSFLKYPNDLWPCEVRLEQPGWLWSNFVCSLIISSLVYEQKYLPHTRPIPSSTFKWAVSYVNGHARKHTLGPVPNAAAKSWGLPVSSLPSFPRFFRGGLKIEASPADMHTFMRASWEKPRHTPHCHLDEKPSSHRITICWSHGNGCRLAGSEATHLRCSFSSIQMKRVLI